MIKFCLFDRQWISIGYHREDQTIEIVPFEFIAKADHIYLIKPALKQVPPIKKQLTCNEAWVIRDVAARLSATSTAITMLRSLPTPFTARQAANMSEMQMRSVVRRNNLKVLPILFTDKYKILLKTCLELISKES